jgi:ribose-phosphate pyrophosphokinase
MRHEQPVLFALGATHAWGEAIARHLELPLAPLEERPFEDGEHKSRPLASVRGRDAYVMHSLYGDADQSVDDKLCRLLFFIGALRDGGAARVTAVIPYLGYARKDRKTKPHDPVTTRYVAQLLEAVGTDRVVTLDVHNLAAYQNAFRCGTEHLEATGLFVGHFAPRLRDVPVTVVSPDAGGIKRAEQFRQALAAALGHPVGAAFAEKYRSAGVVTGDMVVGDVQGRVAIVLDDLISTGGTIARTVAACRKLGATAVHAAASHGLFVGDAAQVLAEPALASIVVTDSVPAFRLPAGPVREKLVVLPTTVLFAEVIACLAGEGSITQLLHA